MLLLLLLLYGFDSLEEKVEREGGWRDNVTMKNQPNHPQPNPTRLPGLWGWEQAAYDASRGIAHGISRHWIVAAKHGSSVRESVCFAWLGGCELVLESVQECLRSWLKNIKRVSERDKDAERERERERKSESYLATQQQFNSQIKFN